VNVLEGLQQIRERLLDNGANPDTIATVDGIIRRAALPAASGATGQSLLQLVRMLQRTPQANANIAVYNDLLLLEEQIESAAAAYRDRVAAEERQAEAHASQRSKKYYKQLKEREEREKGRG
jgi:hypothetical protein